MGFKNDDERTRRRRNYGCEFRTKHRISQFQIELYCTLTHEPCNEQPRKCKLRKKTLAEEKHKTLKEFFSRNS